MKANKAQVVKDTPPEGPKGHKEPKDTPPQGLKCENESPKGQNGNPKADKFFVWDLGTTDRFWQLVGGAHGRRPEVVKDTPLKAQKATKSKRIPP